MPAKTFQELKKNLGKDFSLLPVRRLALLGDSATQFLASAIKAQGYEEELHIQVLDAEFDQLDRQIFDACSELYQSQPEYVVLYLSAERLWTRFARTNLDHRRNFSDRVLAEIRTWWQTIARHGNARVIQLNFVETDDAVFGHYAAKTSLSFPYQLKRINYELMNLAQAEKHVFVANVAGLSHRVGYESSHDPRLYATAKVAFALDFIPLVAKAIVDIVQAASGSLKKCLVLDLDNTLWGGIVGDDGMENIQIGELGMGPAYDALQRWAKELMHRGIILAVCSKNEEETAKRPFREHPDMTLRLEDIAVFVANWSNKAENISQIQKTLNISLDSMVFLDDNPFERNLVRELLPEVTVPELPEDPSMYVSYVSSLNLFETASFSEEDLQRTRQYQEESERTAFQISFACIEEYLAGLKMVSRVREFDEFTVPRVAQLTQRSNQFNLRTIRYSEADIERMRCSDKFITLCFSLKDRFGDHGLIGLIILEKRNGNRAFIDTWIMSCRVLKRGMEGFIVNQMASHARRHGITILSGEYLSSPKNNMVRDLYPQMGFVRLGEEWELDLKSFTEFKTFITEE